MPSTKFQTNLMYGSDLQKMSFEELRNGRNHDPNISHSIVALLPHTKFSSIELMVQVEMSEV